LAQILLEHSRRAGLPRLSPHALRRACATHMLVRGAGAIAIQHQLGHATLQHLSQYLRLSITDIRKMHETSKPGQ
jgi:integrase/recombinase XerC